MEVPQAIEKVLVFKSEQVQMLSVDPDTVAQPVTVEEEKGLSRDSSNVPLISAEDKTKERVDLDDDDEIEEKKPKLCVPKRKLKKLSRMTVSKLQHKVNLKASRNIVLVPQHWSFERKYSQDKGGIEKLAWKLPDFIKRIGIMKVRQLFRERENRKITKIQMRKRLRLKLRTHDKHLRWTAAGEKLRGEIGTENGKRSGSLI
ncbi:splicing factor 3B subunit 2 [Trichonephila clavipes]|nr:splicing factor 3B subunit 2 [Trichonephila clavipes]